MANLSNRVSKLESEIYGPALAANHALIARLVNWLETMPGWLDAVAAGDEGAASTVVDAALPNMPGDLRTELEQQYAKP